MFCLLHDVWANFVKNEEFGYNIPEFYEWRRNDKVEVFLQIPLIIIEPLLYDHIENTLMELPKALLNRVINHSFKANDKERIVTNYCFVATDTKRSIIIDTNGTNIPLRKSKLIPNQELIIWEIVNDEQPDIYKFNVIGSLNLKNKSVGLTRKEKALKSIILKGIQPMKKRNNTAELIYWIQEFNPTITYEEIKDEEFNELYKLLNLTIGNNWSKHYEYVGESLIKGRKGLEKQWKSEIKSSIVSKR